MLPLIKRTSSKSRKAPVVEIVDIPDDEAQRLLSLVMPKDMAKSLVKLIGGRLVHIHQAQLLYVLYKNEQANDVFSEIVQRMGRQYYRNALMDCAEHGNFQIKQSILKVVSSAGRVEIQENVKVIAESHVKANVGRDKERMIMEAVKDLLKANLLRYHMYIVWWIDLPH